MVGYGRAWKGNGKGVVGIEPRSITVKILRGVISMIINNEDILGIWVCESLVCTECSSDEEFKSVKLDELVLRDDVEREVEEKTYFCSRCNERLG